MSHSEPLIPSLLVASVPYRPKFQERKKEGHGVFMPTAPSTPRQLCTRKFENHCPAYSGQTQTRGTSSQSLFPLL